MSLFSALYTGYSGLQVAQLGTDITSNNIANAENPVYTRQRIDVSARFSLHMSPGDIGTGAQVDQVIRVHDEFTYARFREAETVLEYQNYLSQTLVEISEYFPDVLEKGLQKDLLDYFAAWQKLSMNPTEASQKVVLAETAKNLGKNLASTRDKMTEMQKLADQSIVSMVDEINKLAKEIAKINSKIRELEAREYDHANQLRDERDNLELQLQKLTGCQILKTGLKTMTETDTNVADYDENYQIMLGGFTLVNDHNAGKITALKADNASGGMSSIYFVQRDLSQIDISKDIVGGKMGALLDLRGRVYSRATGEPEDGLLQKYKDMLDVFARGVIQSTNQIYASGATDKMSSDQIGSTVALNARQAKWIPIAELEKDGLLRNKVQAGEMVITAYDRNGNRFQPDIKVWIDPKTMSVQQVADAINTELNSRGYDGEAVVSGGQLGLLTNTTGKPVELGALLIADDHSLLRSALGMTGAQQLDIVDAVHIPFTINNGTFTIGVYDRNGDKIATREIKIQKDSENPLYSTLEGIVAQINMPFVDDNKDNDMSNDLDDLLIAGFNGNRVEIAVRDQNAGLYFNIEDHGTLFAGAIGLNKFFSGDSARNLDLFEDFKKDPSKIQAYDLPVVGNNEIANKMQQLQYDSISFFTNDRTVKRETIMGQFKFINAIIAEDTATSLTTLETAMAIENSVRKQFESISKVNVDEELANLIRFQASYGANARVISTIQIMLDTLLGIKM
ncbi:MAG: flagellar hook-associated protein FlgK [Helicobacteraceae bacterium]|jgi:flagellar hook-associated protein 1 FlgK|nr:flagellar hook-associated protein FlgK [Helicobacteraceae bacterium]